MDIQGVPIDPLKTLTLDLPPSCIEFCPAHPEYFVVGTYNLERQDSDLRNQAASEEDEATPQRQQPQGRNGSLVLFSSIGQDM